MSRPFAAPLIAVALLVGCQSSSPSAADRGAAGSNPSLGNNPNGPANGSSDDNVAGPGGHTMPMSGMH